MSRFGVSPAPAFHLLATTHLSELRLSRLALFTVTHLDKLSIASAIQPQFNPSILPAHAPLQIMRYSSHITTTKSNQLRYSACFRAPDEQILDSNDCAHLAGSDKLQLPARI
jgi:hypothetical protein